MPSFLSVVKRIAICRDGSATLAGSEARNRLLALFLFGLFDVCFAMAASGNRLLEELLLFGLIDGFLAVVALEEAPVLIHLLLIHFCLSVFGPPYFFLSKQ